MSTEQKPPHPGPHHKEHAETTVLGESFHHGWEQFKQGKVIGYKWMALILLGITAILVTIYILNEKAKGRSLLWRELEQASTMESLGTFARNHAGTTPGRVAELDRARVLLGPEGIEKIPQARDQTERKKAIANIDTARELMTKLIEEFKNDPILRLECMMGMAKSEAVFIGISKDDPPTEFRGTVAKLIEWLDRIAAEAEGTPWGDDAKKLSASLQGSDSKVKDELVNVQRSLYNVALLPSMPGMGPLAPGGFHPAGEGGFPSLGGIPGSTGGPIAPSTVPPITPTQPTPSKPEPKPPTPSKPEPKPPTPSKPEPKPPTPSKPEPKPPTPKKK